LKEMENNIKTNSGRKRCIGLIGGALWLIVISAAFGIWSLILIAATWAAQILVASSIIIALLIVIGTAEMLAALHMPKSSVPPTPDEKMGRRFALVFGAEILAFSVVNPIAGAMGHYEIMPSLNLIIVGIHFIPLAKIFRVPRYYITGILFCIIPIAVLIAVPEEFTVGETLAWYVYPSLGCGLVAIITAVAGMYEAWETIYKSRIAV
jgi:hypothetical protein